MDSQHSNDHHLEVDANQIGEQESFSVSDAPTPDSNISRPTAKERKKEEESYNVPNVLWTEEMIELHNQIKKLARYFNKGKDPQIHSELKIARSKFRRLFRTAKLLMQEMPDFEELKKIAEEEKKAAEKKRIERKQDYEARMLRKKMGPPPTPGLLGARPLMRTPPGLPILAGQPLMPDPPQGPMRMPSGNRHFNSRRQRGQPPFYSNLPNRPRFPERNNFGCSPDVADSYRQGYHCGFVSADRYNPESHESRSFKQGSSFEPRPFEQGSSFESRPFKQGSSYESRPFEQGSSYESRMFEQGSSYESRPFEQGSSYESRQFEQGSSYESRQFEQGSSYDSRPFNHGSSFDYSSGW